MNLEAPGSRGIFVAPQMHVVRIEIPSRVNSDLLLNIIREENVGFRFVFLRKYSQNVLLAR